MDGFSVVKVKQQLLSTWGWDIALAMFFYLLKGDQVGGLASASTSGTPVRIPPGALCGLGFQSLDCMGFPWNSSLGVFLPHLGLKFLHHHLFSFGSN